MDWLEDDEMRRQWKDVIKEEEKITARKLEGKSLQVEGAQKVPELSVSQVATKDKELHKESRKSKVVGWSTEKMEKASNHEFKDTEDMVQSIRKNGTTEEEVLEKHRV